MTGTRFLYYYETKYIVYSAGRRNGPDGKEASSVGSEERERRRPSRGVAALFPVALCYYEILFRLFTGAGLFRAEVLLALLFSCAYGGFGYPVHPVRRPAGEPPHRGGAAVSVGAALSRGGVRLPGVQGLL